MTEETPPIEIEPQIVEPQNRSTGALILFLFIALPMPFCLFMYHFIVCTTNKIQ